MDGRPRFLRGSLTLPNGMPDPLRKIRWMKVATVWVILNTKPVTSYDPSLPPAMM